MLLVLLPVTGFEETDQRRQNAIADEFVQAAMWGHLQTVRFLLEAGIDKDAVDDVGGTALLRSAAEGHADVVRLLLEASADKNTFDRRGDTAIASASSAGHVEIVRLLLEADADVDVPHDEYCGKTALSRACDAGHWLLRLSSEILGSVHH